MTADELESLRAKWSTLYSQTLPKLARAKDPAQSKWPVCLDHCFARIVLDNTVGRGTQQWDTVLKRPAVRNMTAAQLKDAIRLAESIAAGDADLVLLDRKSLDARGKGQKKYSNKGKQVDPTEDVPDDQQPPKKKGHTGDHKAAARCRRGAKPLRLRSVHMP